MTATPELPPRTIALTTRQIGIALVLPVAFVLAGAAFVSTRDDAAWETSCWILPNGFVMKMPGDSGCTLELNDRLRRLESDTGEIIYIEAGRVRELIPRREGPVRVEYKRRGEEAWGELTVRQVSRVSRASRVGAAALLGCLCLLIPLALLGRSPSRAALPIALLYTATAVVIVVGVAGRSSELLTRAAIVGLIALPSILAHLSLTFPRERQIVREAPDILKTPYVINAFLVPAGWFSFDTTPIVWPAFVYLLIALGGSTWMIVILSCWFAIRESSSAIERARARLLCIGAAVVPILATLALTGGRAGVAETITALVWSSTLTIPLLIGLAVSRYNLFGLGLNVRHWIGRLAYLAVAAGVVAGLIEVALWVAQPPGGTPELSLIFLLAFACAVSVEVVRGRVLGLVESMFTPGAERLRKLRIEYEGSSRHHGDEDEVTRGLAEALRRALQPASGCVFLLSGGVWRPAYAFGSDAPMRTALVAQALESLQGEKVAYLALLEEDLNQNHRGLREQGVELAASIDGEAGPVGLVLLGSSTVRGPYTGAELEFVAVTAAQAAGALRSAQLNADLLAKERQAATGRTAVAVAHDLGKEIDWLSRLARRLPERLDDRQRLERDVSMIREFSEALVGGIRDFVRDSTERARSEPGMARLYDVVDQAVERMGRIHGSDRVVQSIEPAARTVHVHENLGRVVANLLDNALHASAADDPIHLHATREYGILQVVIEDRGSGLGEALAGAAFEPGVTTRRAQGGLGVGLTVSREIIESLGGEIALEPANGGGTRATLRMPIAEFEAAEAPRKASGAR